MGHRLVQDLLAAKRDLSLPRQLRRLDNYDFLLLEDLGYLPQGRRSPRYSSRLLPNTTSAVPRHHIQPGLLRVGALFVNPMATAAAIDRVVHHSVILKFNVPSYRTGVAQQRGQEQEMNRQE